MMVQRPRESVLARGTGRLIEPPRPGARTIPERVSRTEALLSHEELSNLSVSSRAADNSAAPAPYGFSSSGQHPRRLASAASRAGHRYNDSFGIHHRGGHHGWICHQSPVESAQSVTAAITRLGAGRRSLLCWRSVNPKPRKQSTVASRAGMNGRCDCR